jgi:hypothetical protein
VLSEGVPVTVGKGHKRSSTKKKSPRKKKPTISAKAQSTLEGLDPEMRAFLEDAMK